MGGSAGGDLEFYSSSSKMNRCYLMWTRDYRKCTSCELNIIEYVPHANSTSSKIDVCYLMLFRSETEVHGDTCGKPRFTFHCTACVQRRNRWKFHFICFRSCAGGSISSCCKWTIIIIHDHGEQLFDVMSPFARGLQIVNLATRYPVRWKDMLLVLHSERTLHSSWKGLFARAAAAKRKTTWLSLMILLIANAISLYVRSFGSGRVVVRYQRTMHVPWLLNNV